MGTVWQSTVNKYFYAAVALVAAAVVVALLMTIGSLNLLSLNQSKQIAQGQALYAVRCASCHGKNLEGQPHWQMPLPSGRMPAPPHDKTGHTWHHADKALAGVVKLGLKPFAGDNYESDMPAFGAILNDDEIEAILTYIKSTWPERERAYQEQITQQSEKQSTD
jgi:mono/diheme cytochrome c family protein